MASGLLNLPVPVGGRAREAAALGGPQDGVEEAQVAAMEPAAERFTGLSRGGRVRVGFEDSG